MSKILYISCHSVLEYDELKLLTELKHDVFSLGAYTDPSGHITLPRPGLEGIPLRQDYIDMLRGIPRTELPQAFIDEFDIIIVMHVPEIIEHNWERFKNKKVVWRTIGQSIPWIEKRMAKFVAEGLNIVRYSPLERNLKNYAGEHALIRFYKDSEEFGGWNGDDPQVVNFTQSLKGRRDFCGYDEIMEVTEGLNFKVYGPGNEDLGPLNGGELSYDLMKGKLRDARAYIYRGTWPASYTLSFMEAWMTGVPMVCFGPAFGNKLDAEVDTYEIPQLIKHNVNGFCSDDMGEIKAILNRLLTDHDYAREISKKGRESALEYFGKEPIRKQWQKFLGGL